VAVSPFLAVFVMIISPFVGSFLGVLADRLPRGENVTVLPSHCRKCKAPLALRDLVPLLSYLMLRGKCRHCGAPIPWLLPLVETLSVFIIIPWLWIADNNTELVLGAGILWCLVALFFCDITRYLLPNPLTLSLAVLALAFAWQSPTQNLWLALIGGAIGMGSFYIIRVLYAAVRNRQGLGLGDVKLMAGIGILVGPDLVAAVVMVAAFAGLFWILLRSRNSAHPVNGQTALPFGAFLSLACAIVWLIAS